MSIHIIILLFSGKCPTCRIRMKPGMFSHLALNISELLEFSCMNLEQGCQVKMMKNEILKHEREECRYRELQCPGCKKMIAVFILPEHFKECGMLCQNLQTVKFNVSQSLKWDLTKIITTRPVVFKLESFRNIDIR